MVWYNGMEIPVYPGRIDTWRQRMSQYINLNRLEFFITGLCSSNCKHCSVKPKSFHNRHIDKDLAAAIVKRVTEKYNLDSVMTFGGEPLLFPDIVCAIHREARNAGVSTRQVITNGLWSRSGEETERIASDIAEAGVNNVLVSVDAFHQEFISIGFVRKSLLALLKAGINNIKLSPCWIISEKDKNRYNETTKQLLQELEDLRIPLGRGNILVPEGAALEHLHEFVPARKIMWNESCSNIRYSDPLDAIQSVCIDPDGQINACRGFVIGNAVEGDISEALDRYDPYALPEIKIVMEEDMNGLLQYARTLGLDAEPEGYYTKCDMCMDLRRKIGDFTKVG
jgi:hypothetical protein